MTGARITRILCIAWCLASFACNTASTPAALDASRDTDVDDRPDVDMDEGLDSDRPDADRDLDDEIDATPDPLCIAGHDPRAPDLRVYGLDVRTPLGLADNFVLGTVQDLIDSDEISMIFRFADLTQSSDGVLEFATGTPNSNETYRIVPESVQGPFDVTLDGSSFENPYPGYVVILDIDTPDLSFEIPVHDTVFSGEFATNEHCSVGQYDSEESPTIDNGITMNGYVTVSDARESTVYIDVYPISACAFLAGTTSTSPFCDGDPDGWLIQPDITLDDGERAWSVDISLAASAVTITDF